MDIEAERKKFEAWASGFGLRLKQVNGTYVVWQTFCAWEAWQAAVKRCEPVGDGKARLVTEGLEDA